MPTNRAEVKNIVNYSWTFSHQSTREDNNLFSWNNLWWILLFQTSKRNDDLSSMWKFLATKCHKLQWQSRPSFKLVQSLSKHFHFPRPSLTHIFSSSCSWWDFFLFCKLLCSWRIKSLMSIATSWKDGTTTWVRTMDMLTQARMI